MRGDDWDRTHKRAWMATLIPAAERNEGQFSAGFANEWSGLYDVVVLVGTHDKFGSSLIRTYVRTRLRYSSTYLDYFNLLPRNHIEHKHTSAGVQN